MEFHWWDEWNPPDKRTESLVAFATKPGSLWSFFCNIFHMRCVKHCQFLEWHWHQWSSGRIHRCHRCDPGSIPGWCIFNLVHAVHTGWLELRSWFYMWRCIFISKLDLSLFTTAHKCRHDHETQFKKTALAPQQCIWNNNINYKHHIRWRPYRVECTGSLLTSEVKRRRARSVLGWGTAREDLRVLSAFYSSSFDHWTAPV